MRATKKEYDAVQAVVDKFAEAIHKGSSSIVESHFATEAYACGNAGGQLEIVPIQALFDNINALGTAGAAVEFRTDILALEETVAVVAVLEENMGGIHYTNYFTLMKINGQWKIMIHAYNQNSDTI